MSKDLFSFVSIIVSEMITDLARKRCLGCIDNKKCPLNHDCQQKGLLTKFETFYPEVSKKLLLKIKPLASQFISTHPEYNNQVELVTTTINNFLLCSNHRTMYFSGFVDTENNISKILEIFEKSDLRDCKRGSTSIASKPKAKNSKKSSVPLESLLNTTFQDEESY